MQAPTGVGQAPAVTEAPPAQVKQVPSPPQVTQSLETIQQFPDTKVREALHYPVKHLVSSLTKH